MDSVTAAGFVAIDVASAPPALEHEELPAASQQTAEAASRKRNRRRRRRVKKSAAAARKRIEPWARNTSRNFVPLSKLEMVDNREKNPSLLSCSSASGIEETGPSPCSSQRASEGSEAHEEDLRVLRPRRAAQLKSYSLKKPKPVLRAVKVRPADAPNIVGRRIKVFWPSKQKWYYGRVKKYDAVEKTHFVYYDDTDWEWLKLDREQYQIQVFHGELVSKGGGDGPILDLSARLPHRQKRQARKVRSPKLFRLGNASRLDSATADRDEEQSFPDFPASQSFLLRGESDAQVCCDDSESRAGGRPLRVSSMPSLKRSQGGLEGCNGTCDDSESWEGGRPPRVSSMPSPIRSQGELERCNGTVPILKPAAAGIRLVYARKRRRQKEIPVSERGLSATECTAGRGEKTQDGMREKAQDTMSEDTQGVTRERTQDMMCEKTGDSRCAERPVIAIRRYRKLPKRCGEQIAEGHEKPGNQATGVYGNGMVNSEPAISREVINSFGKQGNGTKDDSWLIVGNRKTSLCEEVEQVDDGYGEQGHKTSDISMHSVSNGESNICQDVEAIDEAFKSLCPSNIQSTIGNEDAMHMETESFATELLESVKGLGNYNRVELSLDIREASCCETSLPLVKVSDVSHLEQTSVSCNLFSSVCFSPLGEKLFAATASLNVWPCSMLLESRFCFLNQVDISAPFGCMSVAIQSLFHQWQRNPHVLEFFARKIIATSMARLPLSQIHNPYSLDRRAYNIIINLRLSSKTPKNLGTCTQSSTTEAQNENFHISSVIAYRALEFMCYTFCEPLLDKVQRIQIPAVAHSGGLYVSKVDRPLRIQDIGRLLLEQVLGEPDAAGSAPHEFANSMDWQPSAGCNKQVSIYATPCATLSQPLAVSSLQENTGKRHEVESNKAVRALKVRHGALKVRKYKRKLSEGATAEVVKNHASRRGRPSKQSKQMFAERANCCFCNLLIIESDRCWRERGITVELQFLNGNEWVIMAKGMGGDTYFHKVQQNTPTGTTNRYTHAMMWKGGNGWTLEFTDRRQWNLFKEIYDECGVRNVRAAWLKHIPVPGVRPVLDSYLNNTKGGTPFVRPATRYIHQSQGEVDFILSTSRIVYDMDLEDEEWLRMTNAERRKEHDGIELISEDTYEMIMDKLEKVSYLNKRQLVSLEIATEACQSLSSLDIINAIHGYWHAKREKKGIPLVRYFQPPPRELYKKLTEEWKANVSDLEARLPNASKQQLIRHGMLPPPSAFCLEPKASSELKSQSKLHKQRSQKKLSSNYKAMGYAPVGKSSPEGSTLQQQWKDQTTKIKGTCFSCQDPDGSSGFLATDSSQTCSGEVETVHPAEYDFDEPGSSMLSSSMFFDNLNRLKRKGKRSRKHLTDDGQLKRHRDLKLHPQHHHQHMNMSKDPDWYPSPRVKSSSSSEATVIQYLHRPQYSQMEVCNDVKEEEEELGAESAFERATAARALAKIKANKFKERLLAFDAAMQNAVTAVMELEAITAMDHHQTMTAKAKPLPPSVSLVENLKRRVSHLPGAAAADSFLSPSACSNDKDSGSTQLLGAPTLSTPLDNFVPADSKQACKIESDVTLLPIASWSKELYAGLGTTLIHAGFGAG